MPLLIVDEIIGYGITRSHVKYTENFDEALEIAKDMIKNIEVTSIRILSEKHSDFCDEVDLFAEHLPKDVVEMCGEDDDEIDEEEDEGLDIEVW